MPKAVSLFSSVMAHSSPRGMSAIGTKQTFLFAPHMSAIGDKADIWFCIAHVR